MDRSPGGVKYRAPAGLKTKDRQNKTTSKRMKKSFGALIVALRNGSSLCDPTQGECFFRPEGPNRFHIFVFKKRYFLSKRESERDGNI